MEITLTENQRSVLLAARDMKSSQLSIGGVAGTGKTTVIKELLKEPRFKNWAVSAFTGKAVDVLRSKGIKRAQTMHNLMYTLRIDAKTKELHFNRSADIDRDGVIVDEASMVSKELYTDMLSFNVPIIWVGDMGQLEPIGDDPKLMANPDLKLTEIHRQALESPIIRLSMLIREDAPQAEWVRTADNDELRIYRQNKLNYDKTVVFAARPHTMVICGFNSTRRAINEAARIERGYKDPICAGDKLMCLANEVTSSVFNGMQATVHGVVEKESDNIYQIMLSTGYEEKPRTLKCDISPMINPGFDKKKWMFEAQLRRREDGHNDLTLWDYGYACTCHKAQGSEADEVVVWDQQMQDLWDPIRWRYTAVTRAKKKLIYCV